MARARSQDKIYAIDPLIARLAHLRSAAREDVDPSVLTEMQLGMAIRRRIFASGGPMTRDEFLFYVRTPARKEIDFVSEAFGGAALEGKYIEDGRWLSDAATVNASIWRGVLATRNVLDTASARAWAVPAGLLCYLIDI